jgi:DsbC/DsbD-like thiol-disulfide interchange protein
MIFRALTLATMIASPLAAAPVDSGRAAAEWISSSATVAPGGTVETAVRIRIDDGWHIYWINPGEGGMKTTFTITPPPGWKAEGPAFPAPAHFLTGGLGSFGYAGTVMFPLRLAAPSDFSGNATLRMKVTWLSCDDEACVPGEAEVTLTLTTGDAAVTPQAAAIGEARKQAPHPAPEGLALRVSEADGELTLSITAAGSKPPNLTGAAVFPITPQVADTSRVARLEESGDAWTASLGKSEYASGAVRELALLVAPAGDAAPFELSWRANSN